MSLSPNIPPGAQIIRRRSYKRPLQRPMRGWALIIPAAKRLKIWDQLGGYIIQQVFSKVCHKCTPSLEPQIRPERVMEDTLLLRMGSSSIAATFHYFKDVVLEQLNTEIQKISDQYRKHVEKEKSPGFVKIKQFKTIIGSVQHLPDYRAWQAKPKRVPLRKKPVQHVDVEVVATIGRVQDAQLREALQSLYSTAIASTQG